MYPGFHSRGAVPFWGPAKQQNRTENAAPWYSERRTTTFRAAPEIPCFLPGTRCHDHKKQRGAGPLFTVDGRGCKEAAVDPPGGAARRGGGAPRCGRPAGQQPRARARLARGLRPQHQLLRFARAEAARGHSSSYLSKMVLVNHGCIHSVVSARFATCRTHGARHAAKPLLISE